MHWLIDGHNLIGQMPGIELSDPDDEVKLLEQLRRYRARTGHKLTVIFDAGSLYQSPATKKQGGLTVQFARSGQTADQLIIRRLRRIKNQQAVIVVSSDQAVQQAAQQAGVRVLAAPEFVRELLSRIGPEGGFTDESRVESQAELELSPDEIEEWLALFQQRDP